MNNFKSLIENFERLCPSDAKRGYVCQCGTEKMLKRLREPEAMRAFLLVAIFIDQFIEEDFQNIYSQFSNKFPIPKLYGHPTPGQNHPVSWLICSTYGCDKSVAWSLLDKYVETILNETYLFLSERLSNSMLDNFEELLMGKVEIEFQDEWYDKLILIFQQNILKLNQRK